MRELCLSASQPAPKAVMVGMAMVPENLVVPVAAPWRLPVPVAELQLQAPFRTVAMVVRDLMAPMVARARMPL